MRSNKRDEFRIKEGIKFGVKVPEHTLVRTGRTCC